MPQETGETEPRVGLPLLVGLQHDCPCRHPGDLGPVCATEKDHSLQERNFHGKKKVRILNVMIKFLEENQRAFLDFSLALNKIICNIREKSQACFNSPANGWYQAGP